MNSIGGTFNISLIKCYYLNDIIVKRKTGSLNIVCKNKTEVSIKDILLCKSMDWFLYDNGLRHEIVKVKFRSTTSREFLLKDGLWKLYTKILFK